MKKINCIEQITAKTIADFTVPVSMEYCDHSAVLKHFGLSQADAVTTHLGRKNEEVAYWEINMDGKKHGALKIWTANDSIVKIDLINTFQETEKVAKKLQNLAETNNKLNYFSGVINMEEKAWIYPEIGIAFFLGLTKGVINYISYFQPTTIENYINTLHPINAPREL